MVNNGIAIKFTQKGDRCGRSYQGLLAERVGFEPTIRFNTGYAISSRAPSTTRTPLRDARIMADPDHN